MPSQSQESTTAKPEVRLPQAAGAVPQDEEGCEVCVDGEWRRIRFHDYEEIYSIPGLYERLFYDELECDSPRQVVSMLAAELGREAIDPAEIKVLDVGAGNGMVGEQLKRIGVGRITGVDIIEEAAKAAERDRPDVYDDYLVMDLTDPSAPGFEQLEGTDLDCVVSVAALGFGDIPADAFARSCNLGAPGALVGFAIKDDLVSGKSSPFADLIGDGIASGALEPLSSERYRHRLSVAREPIYYEATIARKAGQLPVSGSG